SPAPVGRLGPPPRIVAPPRADPRVPRAPPRLRLPARPLPRGRLHQHHRRPRQAGLVAPHLLRRCLARPDRGVRTRLPFPAPLPFGPRRGQSGVQRGLRTLEALALPVPPTRSRPEARPPHSAGGLAEKDRGEVPPRFRPRALPLRRLPREQ